MGLRSSVSFTPERESGETGRRTRLRIWRRKAWGFESPLSHPSRFSFNPEVAACVELRWCFRWSPSLPAGARRLSSRSVQQTPTSSGPFRSRIPTADVLPLVARLTAEEEWDMTSDQLIIQADLTWSETSSYKVTTFQTGGISTQQTAASGTYSIVDSKINFVMTVGGSAMYTGSVSGNTLTMIYNGGHFIYSR